MEKSKIDQVDIGMNILVDGRGHVGLEGMGDCAGICGPVPHGQLGVAVVLPADMELKLVVSRLLVSICRFRRGVGA